MRAVWSGAWPRLILATIALCALLFPMAQFNAADSLPAELSNESFRKIISDLSEPEAASRYIANNFVSNELYFQTVIPLVRARTKPGGVYVGVGPEQNFTYIAAFRPHMAFVIDIRRQNMLELLMYKALFEMADNRADFVSILFSRKRPAALGDATAVDDLLARFENTAPDDGLYTANLASIEDRLLNEHKLSLSTEDIAGIRKIYTEFRDGGIAISINGPSGRATGITFQHLMTAGDTQGHADPGSRHSFLATEDDYRFVRSMQQKNLVVPLVGDFSGPTAIRAVGTFVREHGSIVNVFYMSNVTGYLDASQRGVFFDSVRTMPLDQSSTFIRAAGPPALGKQRVPPGRLEGYFSSIVPMLEVLEEVRKGHIQFIPQDIDRISY